MKEMIINNPGELPLAVQALLDYAGGRKKMAFTGEIGAGKTTFIQAFCRSLGVAEAEVVSPTFALINEYEYTSEEGKARPIYHMDLYRLEDIEEALHIGIEDYLYNDDYCLIEWPELIEALLPEDTVRIKLQILGDSIRKILFL